MHFLSFPFRCCFSVISALSNRFCTEASNTHHHLRLSSSLQLSQFQITAANLYLSASSLSPVFGRVITFPNWAVWSRIGAPLCVAHVMRILRDDSVLGYQIFHSYLLFYLLLVNDAHLQPHFNQFVPIHFNHAPMRCDFCSQRRNYGVAIDCTAWFSQRGLQLVRLRIQRLSRWLHIGACP